METTVRDSVGGMAKISILNTSYFWPDDVAHMESETKSETVPLLWMLGFLAGQQHHLQQQQHNRVKRHNFKEELGNQGLHAEGCSNF
ncbi:uncharacterized protein Dsimw501_GD27747 [Drosophila simulans]|nr:uncharacterized protein Dsimw501_GD27747 [Drosophila simulans]